MYWMFQEKTSPARCTRQSGGGLRDRRVDIENVDTHDNDNNDNETNDTTAGIGDPGWAPRGTCQDRQPQCSLHRAAQPLAQQQNSANSIQGSFYIYNQLKIIV